MSNRNSRRKLNRNSSHRGAMKRSLASSIIQNESVKTTLAKAKEIRGFLEPQITLAKVNNLSNQRRVYSIIQDKIATAKLFSDLGPRFRERPGGYLRIIKRGFRTGDRAPIAQVAFVTKSEDLTEDEIKEEATED